MLESPFMRAVAAADARLGRKHSKADIERLVLWKQLNPLEPSGGVFRVRIVPDSVAPPPLPPGYHPHPQKECPRHNPRPRLPDKGP